VAAVVVVGLGYVSLPLTMPTVAVGHDLVGCDIDAVRVKRLEAAESYVEDVPSDELATARNSGEVVERSDLLVVGAPHPKYRWLVTDKPAADIWDVLGNGVRI
jgi:UDP-N-acetyl-D-mannosaminuronate dehydrogenase